MKTLFLIIIGIVLVLGILISAYSLFGLSKSNVGECWYDDNGDGNMLPCAVDMGPVLWDPSPPTELDCDEACTDNKTHQDFDKKTVIIEGKMAQEICSIVGMVDCPPHYVGNVQKDGSVMVGMVISDQEKTRHYQFVIKDNVLSYDEENLDNIEWSESIELDNETIDNDFPQIVGEFIENEK